MAGKVGFHTRKQIAIAMSSLRFVLELSQETCDEIVEKLLSAGHSHRLAPGMRWPLLMDGIEIQPEVEMVEVGGCAPPIIAHKQRA